MLCTGSHRQTVAAILKTPNAIALSALDGKSAATAAGFAAKALAGLRGVARATLREQTVPGQLVISFAPAKAPEALAAAASYTAGFALSSTRWSQLRLPPGADPRTARADRHLSGRAARRLKPRRGTFRQGPLTQGTPAGLCRR